jgi:uncharacterized MAPEG superfamily protein
LDMTSEFIMLAFTLILALVQIGAAAMAVTAERGAKWNASARDGEAAPLGKVAGRLVRAQANLFETLPIFAAAVIMAHVAGKDGDLTFLGTHLYFFGRVVYLPLYAFGVPYLRTLVWLVSATGLVLVLAALFV